VFSDRLSPGEALDVWDDKPILALPQDRPMLVITKYHFWLVNLGISSITDLSHRNQRAPEEWINAKSMEVDGK